MNPVPVMQKHIIIYKSLQVKEVMSLDIFIGVPVLR